MMSNSFFLMSCKLKYICSPDSSGGWTVNLNLLFTFMLSGFSLILGVFRIANFTSLAVTYKRTFIE